jgi:hypothetical protein
MMRRSSVVLNTAGSFAGKDLPANKKAARPGGLFGCLAAIRQIERDPPTASELS